MGELGHREAGGNEFAPHDPRKPGQHNVFRSSACFQGLFYWVVFSSA